MGTDRNLPSAPISDKDHHEVNVVPLAEPVRRPEFGSFGLSFGATGFHRTERLR